MSVTHIYFLKQAQVFSVCICTDNVVWCITGLQFNIKNRTQNWWRRLSESATT